MSAKDQIHYDIAELLEKIAHLNIKLASTDKIHPVELDLLRSYLRELDKLADGLPIMQLPKPSFAPAKPAVESPILPLYAQESALVAPIETPSAAGQKPKEEPPLSVFNIPMEDAPQQTAPEPGYEPVSQEQEQPAEEDFDTETHANSLASNDDTNSMLEPEEDTEVTTPWEPTANALETPSADTAPAWNEAPQLVEDVESTIEEHTTYAKEEALEEELPTEAPEETLEAIATQEEPEIIWAPIPDPGPVPSYQRPTANEPAAEWNKSEEENIPEAVWEPEATDEPETNLEPEPEKTLTWIPEPEPENWVSEAPAATHAPELQYYEVQEPTEAPQPTAENAPATTDKETLPPVAPAPEAANPFREETSTKRSLNDLFSRGENQDLGSRFQFQTRRNLREMIDLSERYIFTKELFGGDADYYDRAIRQLNQFETLEEAQAYLTNELRPKYNWAGKEQVEKQFTRIVERRFA